MAEKTTFKRDRDGNLIAYRGGRRIGPVGGMGDGPAPKSRATKRKKSGK